MYHIPDVLEDPMKKAVGVLQAWCANPGAETFLEFEQKWRGALMEVEREGMALGLKALDVTVDEIEVSGVTYSRGESTFKTYVGLAGEFAVERFLFTPNEASEQARSICPLEVRAGMVVGLWTPCAAEVMAQSAAIMTPYEAERLIRKFGGFMPSRSSLDRLPKALSARWESNREAWEESVRQHETLPIEAEMVTTSLDGVMVPTRETQDDESTASKAKAEAETEGSKKVRYREASCGTVSLHDAEGERLETIYFGRMPESKKPTLHAQLAGEVTCLFETNPDLIWNLIADGAEENWRILGEIEKTLEDLGLKPETVNRIVDFYHASEHLKTAIDLYYGVRGAKARGVYETLRHALRHDDNGVEQVITKLTYFRNRVRKGTKARKKLTTELGYFRKRREQMRYAEFTRRGLPIGTGVTEAACKTLVTQRLKRSGMRWANEGGQAVLTLRSLLLSHRWPAGWSLLADSYREEVRAVRRKGHLRVIEPLPVAA